MSALLIDEAFLPAAISLISNAKKSIYVSTFKAEIVKKRRGLRLVQFFDILVKKKAEKLDVRFLTNKQSRQGNVPTTNSYVIREMQRQRVPTRYLPNNRCTHAKLIIVDDCLAILGSHNLSVKSCHYNFEVSCFIEDPTIIEHIKARYETLWTKAKDA